MRITQLEFHYVQDYNFYDVSYTIDDYAFHRAFIGGNWIKGDNIPEEVSAMLRIKLDCIPTYRKDPRRK